MCVDFWVCLTEPSISFAAVSQRQRQPLEICPIFKISLSGNPKLQIAGRFEMRM
jgi:hypothetical protein